MRDRWRVPHLPALRPWWVLWAWLAELAWGANPPAPSTILLCPCTTKRPNDHSQHVVYHFGLRSVWFQRKAIIIVSIFLAIFIVLIIGLAVFVRDYDDSMSEKDASAAATEQPKMRRPRAPMRRRRWKRRHRLLRRRPAPADPARESPASAAFEEVEEAPSEDVATGVSSALRVSPMDDSVEMEDTSPLEAHTSSTNDAETPSSSSNEAPPDVKPPLLPPAYGNASESQASTHEGIREDAESTTEMPALSAHIATDDKTTLAALSHAASAPVTTCDSAGVPPSAPSWERAEQGMQSCARASGTSESAAAPCDSTQAPFITEPIPALKGKRRVESNGSLPAPPPPLSQSSVGLHIPSTSSSHSWMHSPGSSKDREAAAERAQLAELLPSAPGQSWWSEPSLPRYAPSDVDLELGLPHRSPRLSAPALEDIETGYHESALPVDLEPPAPSLCVPMSLPSTPLETARPTAPTMPDCQDVPDAGGASSFCPGSLQLSVSHSAPSAPSSALLRERNVSPTE